METSRMSTHRSVVAFLFAALLGAAIWAVSPYVTGENEPWDDRGNYYNSALFITGVLAAAVYPQRFWLAPLGIYVGQCCFALIFIQWGPLMVLGAIFGVFFLLPAIGGAFSVFVIHYLLKGRHEKAD